MAVKTLYDGGDTGILFLDRRQFYISPNTVAEKFPDQTPFSTFLYNLPSQTTKDRLYKMFQHRSAFIKQELSINKATPGTVPNSDAGLTVPVDNLVNLGSSVGDHLVGLEVEVWNQAKTTLKGKAIIAKIPSADNVLLKSIKSATIALADNDVLTVIGNVRASGSHAGEAWADEIEVVWNQTQFYSIPVHVDGDLYLAALRGYSSELARLRDEKFKEYKMQKEQSMLKGASVMGTNMDGQGSFSESNNRTIDGLKVTTTYGFISAIEDYGVSTTGDDLQNIFNIDSGTYTYSDFVEDMAQIFHYKSSKQAFAFCGTKAMNYWSKMDGANYIGGKSGWTVNIGDMKGGALGFDFRSLQTPSGVLHLVPTLALDYQYKGYMAIPDQNHIFQVIQEQDQFKNDILKDNDYDGVKDVYRGRSGIGMDLIEKHSLIKIS